jgi:hypothetical protein
MQKPEDLDLRTYPGEYTNVSDFACELTKHFMIRLVNR